MEIVPPAAARHGVAKGRWISEAAHDGGAREVDAVPDGHDQGIVATAARRLA